MRRDRLPAVGADQIIILGRHPDRIALARELGATDVVSERGGEAVQRVRELTDGFGVHSVLECIGLEDAMRTGIGIARPGGAVGRVGVPQDETIPACCRRTSPTSRWRRTCPGPCLRRGAPSGRHGRTHRTGPGLRPGRRPRRRARRLPSVERRRGDQGHGAALTPVASFSRQQTESRDTEDVRERGLEARRREHEAVAGLNGKARALECLGRRRRGQPR